MLNIRTTLFIPASSPKRMLDAGLLGADCILFDLEDSVLEGQKDDARYLIRQFIASGFCEYCWGVRVNRAGSAHFRDDVRMIAALRPFVVELPKTESPDDVRMLDDMLSEVESACGFEVGGIRISPAIETPRALMHTYEIAASSARVVTVPFGAEDYLAAIGGLRTEARAEVDYARKRLVTEVAAAGKMAIDAPFIDVEDVQGLRREAEYARSLGYCGKDAVAPSQVATIKEIFSPRPEEVRHARRVVAAMREAEKAGIGALTLDGQMLDVPILERAKRVLAAAGEADGKNFSEEKR